MGFWGKLGETSGKMYFSNSGTVKRADKSYEPFHSPDHFSGDWPSIAIEVGLSETKAKLAANARWWLLSLGEKSRRLSQLPSTKRRETLSWRHGSLWSAQRATTGRIKRQRCSSERGFDRTARKEQCSSLATCPCDCPYARPSLRASFRGANWRSMRNSPGANTRLSQRREED